MFEFTTIINLGAELFLLYQELGFNKPFMWISRHVKLRICYISLMTYEDSRGFQLEGPG